jgi:hypothetical protein
LRLRQPLGESFNALGFEGEAGWRAAARIKVVLLALSQETKEAAIEKATSSSLSSEVGAKPSIEPKTARDQKSSGAPDAEEALDPIVCGIARELWSDPDVRWLTGVHDAGKSTYIVCEPYEELLWWLQMPGLLRIAGEPSPSKSEVKGLSTKVHEASAAADRAGYRLQSMLGIEKEEVVSPTIPVAKQASDDGEPEGTAHPVRKDSLGDAAKNPEAMPVKPSK